MTEPDDRLAGIRREVEYRLGKNSFIEMDIEDASFILACLDAADRRVAELESKLAFSQELRRG